ncbi:conjugal transfer protein [Streptomyces europaeiscabiei]|uniref:conjugal transfer protein n=1 Tax=Streptomyces europaeiscabiei TaxID=146819 RepID=UPI0029BC4CDD|nr:conjugal transfer protein [Streptomyces europaeiscabiei]MDX2758364.1 conjugal transfer protein [Streptomyces europaeiscabiei]
MKRALTRRPAKGTRPDAPAVVEDEWDIDEAATEDDRVGGWSTGARANTSTLLRWAAWGLLVISPVLGIAAFARASTTGATQPTVGASAPTGTGSQGAAGFATLFVEQYLRAGEGDQEKLAAFYPAANELQLEGEPGRRHGDQLTVVRLRQTDPDVWSVTVAARVGSDTEPNAKQTSAADDSRPSPAEAAADSIHYFQVPIAVGPAGGGATGYTALSMPAEVAAPARIKTPDLIYGPEQPAVSSDPRTEAVTQFLLAYLTGAGELDRYLAPGTKLTAITPAPYAGVAVDLMRIEGDQGSEPVSTVPRDGTRSRLVVTVRATDHDNVRVPLSYALALKARAGRWEIAALDGAPSPALPSQAAPTAPTPASTP